MSRYIVVGAGGIGVTFAAELQRAGRDVALVARGAQLAALRAGELRYARPDGTRRLNLRGVGDPSEIELAAGDVLVLATKTQDVEAVIAQWAPQPVRRGDGSVSTAGTSIPVLTLQNGLEAERVALRRFETVYGAVLWLPASYLGVAEVSAPGWPAVGVAWLGAYPGGAHPGPAAIAADLRAGGFETQVVEDIQRWKAAKLTSSVTFALSALYPPSELRDRAAPVNQAIAERAERAWRDGSPAGSLSRQDLLATVPQLRSGDVLVSAGPEPG